MEQQNNGGGKLVKLVTGEQVAIRNGIKRIKLTTELKNGGTLTKEYMLGVCTNPPVRHVLVVKETTVVDGQRGELIVHKGAWDPAMVARLTGVAEELNIK